MYLWTAKHRSAHEKESWVDVGGVKEDGAETQTVASHLATADE